MKRCLPMLLLVLAGAALLLFPNEAALGAAYGLALSARSVIPALFPFLVLSKCAVPYLDALPRGAWAEKGIRRFFGVSGNCLSPLLLSFCGGYPCGAAAMTEVFRQGGVSKREAERALCFCNNSGPAFFLAVLGGTVLGSVKEGFALYCIHVLSAVLTGIYLSEPLKLTIHPISRKNAPHFGSLFVEAITECCRTILEISAFVVFFSVAAEIVRRLLPPLALPYLTHAETEGLIFGALELSSGSLRLAGEPHAFVLCAFLMGWGGFCVHFQAMRIWHSAGLTPRGYFPHKLLHGLLSAFFAELWLHPTPPYVLMGLIFFLMGAFFPTIRKKRGGNLRRAAL